MCRADVFPFVFDAGYLPSEYICLTAPVYNWTIISSATIVSVVFRRVQSQERRGAFRSSVTAHTRVSLGRTRKGALGEVCRCVRWWLIVMKKIIRTILQAVRQSVVVSIVQFTDSSSSSSINSATSSSMIVVLWTWHGCSLIDLCANTWGRWDTGVCCWVVFSCWISVRFHLWACVCLRVCWLVQFLCHGYCPCDTTVQSNTKVRATRAPRTYGQTTERLNSTQLNIIIITRCGILLEREKKTLDRCAT